MIAVPAVLVELLSCRLLSPTQDSCLKNCPSSNCQNLVRVNYIVVVLHELLLGSAPLQIIINGPECASVSATIVQKPVIFARCEMLQNSIF
jgi:hypothetical protein